MSSLSTRALVRAVSLESRGSTYVASGRYIHRLGGLRLSLELADTRTSGVILAQRLEIGHDEVFDAQAALADRIAQEIASSVLQHEVKRALTLPLPALESYTLLLGAITLLHRQSRQPFEQAPGQMLEHCRGWDATASSRHGSRSATCAARRAGLIGVTLHAKGRWRLRASSARWTPTPTTRLLAIGGLVSGYLRKDFDAAGRFYEQALQAEPERAAGPWPSAPPVPRTSATARAQKATPRRRCGC